MIKIRNYQTTDYSQVKAILQQVNMFDEIWDSEKNLAGIIERNPESILVAEEGKEIVGNILLIPYGPKITYLFRLAVKKEFRRRGIATQLISSARDNAKKKGASEVGLYVDAGNIKLQSFYQKRGFKISKMKYYYMWKELK